jgi:hypothetical protein
MTFSSGSMNFRILECFMLFKIMPQVDLLHIQCCVNDVCHGEGVSSAVIQRQPSSVFKET